MVKEEFPILSQSVNEKPLIYLDNASTTQKPSAVADNRPASHPRCRTPSRTVTS